jgi:hypothetical protein
MKKFDGGTGVSPVQAALGAAEKMAEYQSQSQRRRTRVLVPHHLPCEGVKL